MTRKHKKYHIPFDKKISYDIDKAVVAIESGDKVRRMLGKIWKRKLEKKVWGD